MAAIGIDLGTTNFCAAVWKDGLVKIIINAQGKRTGPSYVAFKKTDCLIGDRAKNQISMNSANTLFNIKRLIGKKITDPKIQSLVEKFPFKVIKTSDEIPQIEIKFCNELLKFYPEEISSMIVGKLKETAEEFLGEKVENAVIAVPVTYNFSQRYAIKVAGEIAGLNILRVITETSASALTYGFTKNVEGQKNVLIFDMGGGNTDVAVVNIDNNGSFYEVITTAGNSHLGGDDFDSRLVDYLCNEFEKISGKNVSNNFKIINRIRAAAVRAKHNLSGDTDTIITIDSLIDDTDYNIELTRKIFEEICDDLFNAAIDCVENALLDKKIEKKLIDQVLLVGGSTRIPKIQRMLEEYFDGKKLNLSINSDETVACGAAIQAALLSENSSIFQSVEFIDVMPTAVGISIFSVINSDNLRAMIEKNHAYPGKSTIEYSTTEDNQKEINFKIYEGDEELFEESNLLHSVKNKRIRSLPAGMVKINFFLDVNVDGVIQVKAQSQTTGRTLCVTIFKDRGRWSKEEVDGMIMTAQKIRDNDKKQRDILEAKYKLESYLYSIKQSIGNDSFELNEGEKIVMTGFFNQIAQWINDNQQAPPETHINKLDRIKNFFDKVTIERNQLKLMAKRKLEFYLSSLKETVDEESNLKLIDICNNLSVDDNEILKIDDYKEKLKTIRELCEPLMTNNQRDKIIAETSLKSYILSLNLKVDNCHSKFTDEEKSHILECCKLAENWMDRMKELADFQDYEKTMEVLQKRLDSIERQEYGSSDDCSDQPSPKIKKEK